MRAQSENPQEIGETWERVAGDIDDTHDTAAGWDQAQRRHALALASMDAGSDSTTNVLVESAIAAWLHVKHGRSGSTETLAAYARTIQEFRALLRERDLDLDAADPRRVRAALSPMSPMSPMFVDGPVARTTGDEGRSTAHPDQEQVEDLVSTRISAIATLAQAYAARPGRHGGARASRQDRHIGKDRKQKRTTQTAVTLPSATRPHITRAAAPTTVNRRLAILSSFYSYALKQGLLRGENPIVRVERRHVESYAGAEPLDYEDLDARLGAIDRATPAGLRDYALLLLGLHTGRRLSELAGMRREHVTIRRGGRSHLTLVWPRVKGGKRAQARLPLHGAHRAAALALVAWIDALYGEDGRHDSLLPPSESSALMALIPITADADSPYSPPDATEPPLRPLWISLARNGSFGHPLSISAIADICTARLGTSKVHALRHTYARGLEDAGAKVSQIQAYLGHADLGTTGRYLARLTPEENPYLGRLGDLFLTHQSRATPSPPVDEHDTHDQHDADVQALHRDRVDAEGAEETLESTEDA